MQPSRTGRKPSWTLADARDYVLDGCWEAILNGKCDFTYNMVNLLTVLECSLNGGALLSRSRMQLRGAKKGFLTTLPARMQSFADLQEAFKIHLTYFTNRTGLELYANFCLEGSTTPAPLLSAMLGRCLEKGIDKTWGGADHILGGIVYIALPNVANSLAALKEWVFDKGKYRLTDVVAALRNNFEGAEEMRRDFLRSPKFGNSDPAVDSIMAWLMDEVHGAVQGAQELADHVFLTIPRGSKQGRRIAGLRSMAGYLGGSLREKYGDDFDIRFTVGCGTFEQYAYFGVGCAASPDGRLADEPVTPNFSPTPGTVQNGIGAVLDSLSGLRLDRFACGVVTDLCVDRSQATPALVEAIINRFIDARGSILTLTVTDPAYLAEIRDRCVAVREGREQPRILEPYADQVVRVGGWNGFFVALTDAQQQNYLLRALGTM